MKIEEPPGLRRYIQRLLFQYIICKEGNNPCFEGIRGDRKRPPALA
jgi:hypothetical protein